MDFTIKKYKQLLTALLKHGYNFQTYADFHSNPKNKTVILRHDVDKSPENSLKFAQIQSSLGIKGSYYFRMVPESFNEIIIKEIATLGHEIGYHYETMDTSHGDLNAAKDEFVKNLEILRNIVSIKTICMHGSPLSKFDNRNLWQNNNYRDYGIIAEPYFDVDFEKIFYITDTGRRFDGGKVSVRDKPMRPLTKKWPVYHSTDDILFALKQGIFPNTTLMTFHPQRWNEKILPWLTELMIQNIKNIIKSVLISRRNSKTSVII
jgi:hypothetical protein